jgi:GntR family transcriptional regulator/MocR family aminotransferase
MAIEWSGLSPELLVRLDRAASQPLRTQLETSLREAIRAGRLRAGERLPSSRELARELGVSRGMVQDCYGQLLAEGYLTSRTGSATRVASVSGEQAGDQPVAGPAAGSPGPGRRLPEPPLIADFQPGVPDLSSFPRTDWAWAIKQACTHAAAAVTGAPRWGTGGPG